MKSVSILLGAGLVSLLAGCASTPIALAPVGPNPVGIEGMASQGELQVFSSLTEQSDNQNQGSDDPVWYQHTGYGIYSLDGKLVERVDNAKGHYSEAPLRVSLPAGRYLVRAEAEDYVSVEVPVVIERGRTTRVHLDDNWKLAPGTPGRELVSLPNGNPVGWRAESAKETGTN